jgi:hypothetical protein
MIRDTRASRVKVFATIARALNPVASGHGPAALSSNSTRYQRCWWPSEGVPGANISRLDGKQGRRCNRLPSEKNVVFLNGRSRHWLALLPVQKSEKLASQ